MFFFFKQKTAYEMRISDWSSDVCSSDLPASMCSNRSATRPPSGRLRPSPCRQRSAARRPRGVQADLRAASDWPAPRETASARYRPCRQGPRVRPEHLRHRSEEHTSELQSLMRISYAVFCLKKKNNTNI